MENINNENTNDHNHEDDNSVIGSDDSAITDENVPQDNVLHDETDTGEVGSNFSVDTDTEDAENTEQANTAGAGFARAGTTPPPPAAQYIEHRLTRDPSATFGGVLSGIAHRYGWDVSLTRLAFVVALVATGGGAVLVYLLSWLIIPRAIYWPPVIRTRAASQVSSRDIGIGLIVLAVIVMLGIGAGQAAAILVPLALIGGGMWMLVQNPRGETAPAAAFAGMPSAPTADDAPVGSGGGYQMPLVAPQPAPSRSRRSKVAILGLIGLVLLVPLLIIGGLFAAVATGGGRDFTFEVDGAEILYTPATIEEIPTSISEEEARIVLDLSEVDFSSVDTRAERVDIDVDLDFGELEVILPVDVRVDISADADLAGDVAVFGEASEGLFPDVNVFSDDDPQLVLDLEVFGGKISVERAS